MDWEVVIWIPIITAIITLVFNVIFHSLKNRLDWFVDKKKFEREYSYNQLRELYLSRYMYKFDEQFSILEILFLEIKRKVEKDVRRVNSG